MTESEAIQAKDRLTTQLIDALAKAKLFPKDGLARVLDAESLNIYARHMQVVTGGPYELIRLPFTVQGEYAGQQPFWQLTRRNGSGLLIAGFTLYTQGCIDRGKRIHIVGRKMHKVGREDRELLLIDSLRAVKLVEKEIKGLHKRG